MRSIVLSVCMMCCALTAAAQRFCIAGDGKAATIVVDEQDWKGVIRAAKDLGDDVRKVTGTASTVIIEKLKNGKIENSGGSIIVGTLGKSALVDKLVKQQKLDIGKIRGQWESFVIDIVEGNLVVAGSDKRGTIYGIYEISQRIGVSPWYWWADVPVQHKDAVYWDTGRSGIFDEFLLLSCKLRQVDAPTAVSLVTADQSQRTVIYGIGGEQRPSLRRGMNIIRTSDGKTKKVIIK